MLSTFVNIYNTGQALYPGLDFETYSEAGYIYDTTGKRHGKGIAEIGMAVYAEHPTTEILCAAYQLIPSGEIYKCGPLLAPFNLFTYISRGGIISAANSMFEYLIWNKVCIHKYGWPPLPLAQLRDTLAAAQQWSLPGKLEDTAKILQIAEKDPKGKRLIQLLSVPQSLTEKYPCKRRYPVDHPQEMTEMVDYNIQDVKVESDVSAAIPQLSLYEENLWLLDQQINNRGVTIDISACKNMQTVIDKAYVRYEEKLQILTQGVVKTVGQVGAILKWLNANGVPIDNLMQYSVDMALNGALPTICREVLEIRQLLGSASIKKVQALLKRTNKDGRIRNLLRYCGASRTARWAGSAFQPQNLPRSGPPLGNTEWSYKLYDTAFTDLATEDIDYLTAKWKNPLKLVSGCLRGLITAAPGYELISSDFTAIEAVVLAVLAGEEWRLKVFQTHGKIYETTASMITGVPLPNITKALRTLGKTAELASGYQGGIDAWKRFGADKFLSDVEIKTAVKKWREKNPRIVDFWNGVEHAAITAIQNPGRQYDYNTTIYCMEGGTLYCQLSSGRYLKYHNAHLRPDVTPWGKPIQKIYFKGWNSNPQFGPIGWVTLTTYGGSLTENIVQATSRDILADALIRIDPVYPVVLHVHDEILSEVPKGYGGVEEYEHIMADSPAWCREWPIKAVGGWRSMRYRK